MYMQSVVVYNSLETVVAEISKVEFVPIDTVSALILYGIHHFRTCHLSSARPFRTQISVMSTVEIEGEWKVEIKLFLLEGIARLEA